VTTRSPGRKATALKQCGRLVVKATSVSAGSKCLVPESRSPCGNRSSPDSCWRRRPPTSLSRGKGTSARRGPSTNGFAVSTLRVWFRIQVVPGPLGSESGVEFQIGLETRRPGRAPRHLRHQLRVVDEVRGVDHPRLGGGLVHVEPIAPGVGLGLAARGSGRRRCLRHCMNRVIEAQCRSSTAGYAVHLPDGPRTDRCAGSVQAGAPGLARAPPWAIGRGSNRDRRQSRRWASSRPRANLVKKAATSALKLAVARRFARHPSSPNRSSVAGNRGHLDEIGALRPIGCSPKRVMISSEQANSPHERRGVVQHEARDGVQTGFSGKAGQFDVLEAVIGKARLPPPRLGLRRAGCTSLSPRARRRFLGHQPSVRSSISPKRSWTRVPGGAFHLEPHETGRSSGPRSEDVGAGLRLGEAPRLRRDSVTRMGGAA